MPRNVVLEVVYPHSIDQVWSALTQADRMALWLMNFDNDVGEMSADFRPVAGTPFRLEARKGRGWRGYVVGQVLEVDAPRHLAYTWAHSAAQDAHPVHVDLTLSPAEAGTRLRVELSDFAPGLKGWFAAKGMQMGWGKMLRSSILGVLGKSGATASRV